MNSVSGSRIVRYWLCLLLLLSACATPPAPQAPPVEAVQIEQQKSADELIQLANNTLIPTQRYTWLLEAASKLFDANDTARAAKLLEQLPSHELEGDLLANYTRRYATWALAEKNYPLAGTLLTDPRLDRISSQVESLHSQPLLKLQAQYYEETWQYNKALDTRLALSLLLLETNAISENNQSIWRILAQLTREQRDKLAVSDTGQLKPWLELASILNSDSIDINPQLTALEGWKVRWQGHPAAMSLPAEINHLHGLSALRPKHITLLLPQTGPLAEAGLAVIDGFLAAFYEARLQTTETPVIRLVDSHSQADFLSLYQSVAQSGTDLVIGPLDKERLQTLFELETLPVPTLALNYAEIHQHPSGQLTQFGLSPEDDARQILDLAQIRGYSNALILVPESNWGERVAQYFTDGWLLREGTVTGITYFNPDKGNYSAAISHFLGIDDSKQRHRDIQRITGARMEFEPRRRQDIDVIFLNAQPRDARQIKPMLAFHYANNIPLIASSAVYSGYDDPIKDNDLNGMLFLALPWHLEKSPSKLAIHKHLGDKNRFQGLYALGVDTYRLHVRPGLLQASPESRINGSVGVLTMDEHPGRVNRQQVWMKMISGQARHYTPEH